MNEGRKRKKKKNKGGIEGTRKVCLHILGKWRQAEKRGRQREAEKVEEQEEERKEALLSRGVKEGRRKRKDTLGHMELR